MPHFEKNVFINCPFDPDYFPIFRSIVFTLIYCGLEPRCALESRNGAQIRMEKIFGLIEESKYSIHDISRVELDPNTNLPRFNMPFELGLFLGAKKYGTGRHATKNCLILEENKFDYQKYLSDIAGQDSCHHERNPVMAIEQVRNWVLPFNYAANKATPSHQILIDFYNEFNNDLPSMCAQARFDQNTLQYIDYLNLVKGWITAKSSTAVIVPHASPTTPCLHTYSLTTP